MAQVGSNKIELSAGIAAGVQTRVLRYGDTTSTSGSPAQTGLLPDGSGGGTPYYDGRIYLMKGTAPTDLSTLTTVAQRAADVLVMFSVQGGAFADVQANVTPAIISTLYRNASAAGTASWFWLTQANSSGTIVHSIVGSVGLVGSGADLEMDNNVVVSGQPYRVLNLRVNFSTAVWTY